MEKNTLCLATNNAHKAEELQSLLGDAFEIKTLKDIGCLEDIEETGNTFVENSMIKAGYVFRKYGMNVLADDSGLEVNALGGRPGVYSARYAGEPSDATANNRKLMKEMEGVTDRTARFRTVITLILEGETHTFDGEVSGRIKETFDGEEGFGYNPVFIPDGFETTFHDMGFEQRSRLNHRGRAMAKVLDFLARRNTPEV
ncbi:RdgB/HAM1 family non-canonical purine NTP pyrophosphatase [Leadbetterella sp. DM7]|uniref:RdgB/HAM1 family non-canonical purine NTP pyrophosphatase n=1 Tax=Leadbetterella sp. DM7 TaxID=3235085 RepID=UPI00349E63EF